MPYVAPTSKSTGTFITPAIWNQDVVDNQNAAFPLGVGEWTAYTPTVKFGATTATLSANNSRYIKVGRWLVLQILVKVSNLNGGTGNLTVTIPVAVAARAGTFHYGTPIGSGGIVNGGTGVIYPGFVTPNNTTDVVFRTTSAQPSAVFTHAAPTAVAATDEIHATVTYEAAT